MPANLEELKDIAEFFQGRDIDGTTVYGAAIYTERGSDGITMGVTNALYNYGFEYENPNKPNPVKLVLEGLANGRAWCCRASRRDADVWKEIWAVLEDLGGPAVAAGVKIKAHVAQWEVDRAPPALRSRYLANQAADHLHTPVTS